MIFQLENGSIYTANVEYYDIEIKEDTVNIYIGTDRGEVWYALERGTNTQDNPVYTRNTVDDVLKKNNSQIIDAHSTSRVCFGDHAFNGSRKHSDFFPRGEEKLSS